MASVGFTRAKSSSESQRRLGATYEADTHMDPSGLYYMTIVIAGQTVHAVVDTGSALTHVACAGCTGIDCQQIPAEQRFIPARSTQQLFPVACGADCDAAVLPATPYCGRYAPANVCGFVAAYGDGSHLAAGTMLRAPFAWGDQVTVAPITFGCDGFSQGVLLDVPEGLIPGFVGLDRSPGSLPSQLAAAGIVSPRLSYCLGVNEPGSLALGDAVLLPPLNARRGTTTPMPTHRFPLIQTDWATVVKMEMTIHGQKVTFYEDSNGTDFILDTGTTDIRLPPAAYRAFLHEFNTTLTALQAAGDITEYTELGYNGLEVIATAILNETMLDSLFPQLRFGFMDATGPAVIVPPTSYIMDWGPAWGSRDDAVRWRYRVFITSTDLGIFVLGQAFLGRMVVQVDRESNDITMLPVAHCDSSMFIDPALLPSPPSPAPPPQPPTLRSPSASPSASPPFSAPVGITAPPPKRKWPGFIKLPRPPPHSTTSPSSGELPVSPSPPPPLVNASPSQASPPPPEEAPPLDARPPRAARPPPRTKRSPSPPKAGGAPSQGASPPQVAPPSDDASPPPKFIMLG